jgi:hypothetical protein
MVESSREITYCPECGARHRLGPNIGRLLLDSFPVAYAGLDDDANGSSTKCVNRKSKRFKGQAVPS